MQPVTLQGKPGYRVIRVTDENAPVIVINSTSLEVSVRDDMWEAFMTVVMNPTERTRQKD